GDGGGDGEGLAIMAIPKRESPLDCFLSATGAPLNALPAGAIIGTASLRRQALLQRHRPDLQVRLLRGNINSRLEKLARGEVDGMVLAVAGLRRLQLEKHITEILSAEHFPPAPSQGAVVLVGRRGDADMAMLAQVIHDQPTAQAVLLERQFLRLLDGSCKTPIGCLVELRGGQLSILGFVANGDLSQPRQKTMVGAVADGQMIIKELAESLRN
ncbi:MAG: hydroxymethylbilane synthase, partial [Alphaproteobacteria bacterium]|nr:hydroxymethylbilane synthase [Alphaproteobacteria bacterium]